MPDFTMTGQDGKPFKLSDLRGHVVVLTFIYTRCPLPDFCPFMDRKFADLAQTIAAFPDRARQSGCSRSRSIPTMTRRQSCANMPGFVGPRLRSGRSRSPPTSSWRGYRPAGSHLRTGQERNHP